MTGDKSNANMSTTKNKVNMVGRLERLERLMLLFTLLILSLISGVGDVYAYIDPGTGGMILGSIWSTIAAVFALISAFFIRHFIEPIKRRIHKLWMLIKNIGQ